jgi:hypothetical protein
MNSRSWLVMLIAVVFAPTTLAQSIGTEFFSATLPDGWVVRKDSNGSVIATPTATTELPSVSVDLCNRRTQSNCPASCEPEKLRPNFFYFFADQPSAVYSEVRRTDGFRDIRAVGSLGEPSTWIAASVLCGPAGLVYIGSMSAQSRAQAVDLLERAISSVHWQSLPTIK